MNNRIEIIGVLASGKTTLLKIIKKQFGNINCHFENLELIKPEFVFYEQENNKNLFFLQSVFYNYAFDIINKNMSNSIFDFSLWGHHNIYTKYFYNKGLISNLEFKHLSIIYQNYISSLNIPAGIIICDIAPKVAYKNMIKRNRQSEISNTFEYIENLTSIFNSEITKLKDVPIIRLSVNEINIDKNIIPDKLNVFINQIINNA